MTRYQFKLMIANLADKARRRRQCVIYETTAGEAKPATTPQHVLTIGFDGQGVEKFDAKLKTLILNVEKAYQELDNYILEQMKG